MTTDLSTNGDGARAATAAIRAEAVSSAASPFRQPSHASAQAVRSPAVEPSAGCLVGTLRKHTADILLVLAGLLLIGLTALLDYGTGPELSLAIFYLLPIAAGAWWGGFAHGILLSVASVIAWHLVEVMELPDMHPGVRLWNDVVRFCFFVITSSLLTRQRLALRREQAMARTDPLTGAANGRTFYEVAQLELQRVGRTGRPFTVAYLDVDNFKAVNDRLGHAAGDALLRRFAETVQQHTRANDLLARLGGDEFALLLPETDADGAVSCLGKLREALLREVSGTEVRVTYSIGAATFLKPPRDVDAVVRRVDALMYAVKRGGKDRVHHEVVSDIGDMVSSPVCVERHAEVRALIGRPVRVVRDDDAERRVDFATVRDLTVEGIGLQLSHEIERGTLLTVEPVCGGRARTLLARVERVERTTGGWLHVSALAHRLSEAELQDWLS